MADRNELEDKVVEFTAEKSLSDKEQRELVVRLDNMFRYAVDHPSWIAGRAQMVKCFKYREGEQWTAAELKELETRHQPDTVNNQVAVVVNKIIGDLAEQRVRIGFRGRNDPSDTRVADALTDIFRYIRQNNDLEFEERDMAEDGVVCGMGVLDVAVTFDDLFQPEIKIRHEDPLIVFPDPDSRRYDWNEDAKFIARAKWFSLEEARELYPQASLEINRVMSGLGLETSEGSAQISEVDQFKGENYVDQKKRRVRIIEVEYKKYEREEIVLFADGRSMPKDAAKVAVAEADAAGTTHQNLDRVGYRICVGVYAAGILLEHKITNHRQFSLVPYTVYRKKSGEPYSLITLALSMQDAINKRESKALHLLNTNQVVFERTAVLDKEALAVEMHKPDGQIEVQDGALSQKRIEFLRNLELAASQFNLHKAAQEDFFRIVGVDLAAASKTGEIRSGTGLQRKFTEAAKPILTIFENVRRTRKILGRVVLDRVQNYYTPNKVLLITDDGNQQYPLTIDAQLLEKIKTSQYDVIVEEMEDTTTLQQEQFQLLASTLPQILQFGPYYTKLLLRMSQLRDKDQFIKELEAQEGPPPVEPRVSVQANLDALTPPERAFFYKRMGDEQLAVLIMEMAPPTTSQEDNQAELQQEMAKGQVEMAKEQVRGRAGMAKEQVKGRVEIIKSLARGNKRDAE